MVKVNKGCEAKHCARTAICTVFTRNETDYADGTSVDRRGFLKTASAGLAAASVLLFPEIWFLAPLGLLAVCVARRS